MTAYKSVKNREEFQKKSRGGSDFSGWPLYSQCNFSMMAKWAKVGLVWANATNMPDQDK